MGRKGSPHRHGAQGLCGVSGCVAPLPLNPPSAPSPPLLVPVLKRTQVVGNVRPLAPHPPPLPPQPSCWYLCWHARQVVGDVRRSASSSPSCWSYHGCGVLCEQSGAGNNWALGYQKYGPQIRESALELVRREVG